MIDQRAEKGPRATSAEGRQKNLDRQGSQSDESSQISAPSISLPKGGGAIRRIGEKFAANPVTGTGSMTVPIAVSPGRSGIAPQLSLSYDSGSGNVPGGLTAEEAREACRSLKGSIFRVEIYALHRKEESDRPYSVSERNYPIRRLQPFGGNHHAVFFTHARESIDFHYERKLYDDGAKKIADPRVPHSLTLDVDQYGNVLRSADVAYGRRLKDGGLSTDDQKRQARTHVTFTENGFTNAVLESGDYRAPFPSESQTYELLNVRPSANVQGITNLFRYDELNSHIVSVSDQAATLPYQEWDADEESLPRPRRRLIKHLRTLYRKNDLSGFWCKNSLTIHDIVEMESSIPP